MPVTNTFKTTDAAGIREDLANVIYDISPEDTPFQSNIGRGPKPNNTLFEWQVDSLADPDAGNAVAEGADVTEFDEVDPTVRLQNHQQISRKTVVISNTMESVDTAGRRSELAYQLAKRGKELKRDIETIALGNQGAAGGTTRTTASLQAYLKTNTNFDDTAGEDPDYTNLPDAGRVDSSAQRAFTEAMLKDVIQKCWKEGADPSILMVGPINKQNVSAFPGIAETRVAATSSPTTIIGAADIYVSDFGNLSVVPNRFQRERDAFVLDPEYAEMRYLRPYKQTPLAKTGDAEKRMMLVEWGTCVKNEKAHGIIADLTTTLTT